MRALIVLALSIPVLLLPACARDWPVPVRNFSQGRVALGGEADGACRMVAHVLHEPADARDRLGAGFARTLREELELSLPDGAAPAIPPAEVERALEQVAWGQEMGVLLMAGPCHPGIELDRVVQPGTGPSRWELRLIVDPQPGPPAVTWILAGAIRGNAPPMAVEEPGRRLRPGRDRLTLTAWPIPPGAVPPGS
jgi:hypothetical protein